MPFAFCLSYSLAFIRFEVCWCLEYFCLFSNTTSSVFILILGLAQRLFQFMDMIYSIYVTFFPHDFKDIFR